MNPQNTFKLFVEEPSLNKNLAKNESNKSLFARKRASNLGFPGMKLTNLLKIREEHHKKNSIFKEKPPINKDQSIVLDSKILKVYLTYL